MPTLEEFFANAIEQNDPEAMVEDQYKSVGTKTAEISLWCRGYSQTPDQRLSS